MTLPRGVNTSEFWISALTTVLGWLVVLGVPVHVPDTTIQVLSGMAATLAPIAYTIARTMLKLQLPPLPAVAAPAPPPAVPPAAQPLPTSAPAPLATFSVIGPTSPALVSPAA